MRALKPAPAEAAYIRGTNARTSRKSTPVDACPFAPFTDPFCSLASLPATGTPESDASTSPNLNAMDEVGEGSTELGVSGAGGEQEARSSWAASRST